MILVSAERLSVAEAADAPGLAVRRSGWQRRFAEAGVGGLLRDAARGQGRPHLGDATSIAWWRSPAPNRRVRPPTGRGAPWPGRRRLLALGPAYLGCPQAAAASHPHLQALARSRLRRQARGHRRSVHGPPKHAIVLSVDEKSQALDRTQPGLLLKPGKAGTFTHDYVRNGTTTLFAALNVLEGTVIGRCMQRHRHQEFVRFLSAVERAVPAGKVIHAIVDNYGSHERPNVLAWLARHPRWTFRFTPTSGSWLNAVETFFSALTRPPPHPTWQLPLGRRPPGCHQPLQRRAQR
jgi:hypothetical protein